MICVDNGKLHPLPFEEMLDPKTNKTQVRYLDILSDGYKVARSYMVRLEKRDIEDKAFLAKMAEGGRMSPEEFLKKFEYLVKEK